MITYLGKPSARGMSITFENAQPGDVGNSSGDIRLHNSPEGNALYLTAGVAEVSEEQAEAARYYGWKRGALQASGRVQIRRDYGLRPAGDIAAYRITSKP